MTWGATYPGMIHPASHCPLLVLSRSDGRSAVAAAAYAARTKMTDQRTGLSFNYRYTPGLLEEGLVNWHQSAEALWNAAEKSEAKSNARVARELRPALPAELPLDEQRRLVHGFSLWLKDEYGVAVHWVVHAPTFHRKSDSKRLWLDRKTERGWQEYLDALADPEMTNLNYHAHIRFTVRRVEGDTGEFFEKTRDLDKKDTGPECVRKIRAEWEKRTNAALARNGSRARIDLRSYEDMAKAGDAPEGLEAQKHQGPKQTARIRRAENQIAGPIPLAALEREFVQDCNSARWSCWEEIRRIEREKLRLEKSALIARERENERLQRVRRERVRLSQASSVQEQVEAVEAATTIDVPHLNSASSNAAISWSKKAGLEEGEAPLPNGSPHREPSSGNPPTSEGRIADLVGNVATPNRRCSENPWMDAIECVKNEGISAEPDRPVSVETDSVKGASDESGSTANGRPTDEFDQRIDPETFVLTQAEEPPAPRIRVVKKERGRGARGRGD
jgi:hypothetical protein